jgi:FkbM family methyltransferase
MPSSLKKALYRKVRYNPWTEKLQNSLRTETRVYFDEIGCAIPAGPGDIIIDAGANVGDVTSRCARTGATVHAFEPNPVCYAILKKRFAGLSNVRTYNVGVMDKPCSLTLTTPKPDETYDSVETTIAGTFIAPPSGAEGIETTVECIDLSEFIRTLDRPVTLLKMDIEGAEVAVLNRLLDTGIIDRVDFALVETHERLSDDLARSTAALRDRIKSKGLEQKVRLDWI